MRQKNILPILFSTLLLDMIGVGMLIPVIPSLFTDPTSSSFMLQGYSVSAQYIVAGLVTALFGFMQFLAAPFLGELSDLYGRKKLLAIGVGMLAIANLVFAAGIALGSLMILLASRIIAGIAGANFSIAQAAIADVTAPENRAKNFGLIGAAFGLGFVFGPLIGGWLSSATGSPAVPFIFAGILGIVNLLLVTFIFPETHPTRASNKKLSLVKAFHNIADAWNDVGVRPIYLVGFLSMLGFSFFTSFIAVFLVHRFQFTQAMTGTYFAFVGVWVIFAQAVVVRFVSARYSERKILTWALPALAAVIAIYPLVPSVIYLYLTMPIMAAAFGLINTSVPSLVSKGVSAEKQGTALGINGSLQALTSGIAPLIAGVTSGFLGLNAAFLFGATIVLLAFFLVRGNRRRRVTALNI